MMKRSSHCSLDTHFTGTACIVNRPALQLAEIWTKNRVIMRHLFSLALSLGLCASATVFQATIHAPAVHAKVNCETCKDIGILAFKTSSESKTVSPEDVLTVSMSIQDVLIYALGDIASIQVKERMNTHSQMFAIQREHKDSEVGLTPHLIDGLEVEHLYFGRLENTGETFRFILKQASVDYPTGRQVWEKSGERDELPYLMIDMAKKITELSGHELTEAEKQRITDRIKTIKSPGHLYVHGKAVVMQNVGEHTKALQFYQQIMNRDAASPLDYLYRGQSFLRLKEDEAALFDFTQAIEKDPFYGEAYKNRGMLHASNQRMSEALTDLNRALELNPYDGFTYFVRGMVHNASEETNKALQDFTSSIQYQPDNIFALTSRGELYHALGKYPLAIADFKKAAKQQTDNAAHREQWVWSMLHNGDYVEAIKEAKRGVGQFSDNVKLSSQLLIAYLLANQYDDAKAFGQKSLPNNARLQTTLKEQMTDLRKKGIESPLFDRFVSTFKL